ncbi:acyl-CoA desaturase [Hahella sp. SMD15-11]|uniref:Acyl-CoA desaturase n=1 Tax=Thermohahella caldifontis TaxID=3142973 RepID=A0AB39USS2_9GAMM
MTQALTIEVLKEARSQASAGTPSIPAPEKLDALARELDALRDAVRADLGERDASYIRNLIRIQRMSEIAGRTFIHLGITPVSFGLGVVALSIAKILDNMEIGHNVMHGQYDWMNDPLIHSRNFDWDTACDKDSWKRTHNYEHHTFTNIVGKDRDYGYAVLRLSDDTPWHPLRLPQIVYFGLLSLFFQWGVALHELEAERLWNGTFRLEEKKGYLRDAAKKAGRQIFKDYVFFPALAGPLFWKVMLGNGLANAARNLWASTIIFCGHFTEGAHTFTPEECENESRGHWYYRQLTGSSNFEGGRWLHILSGHLSYQIEHHLFPDLPAHRYPEISLEVRRIAERYGIPYNTGPFWKQYLSVVKRVLRYSLPGRRKHRAAGMAEAAVTA